MKLADQVEGGGFAFDAGVEGEDDLLDAFFIDAGEKLLVAGRFELHAGHPVVVAVRCIVPQSDLPGDLRCRCGRIARDDLDADSLDRLQLVTAMEDEFDIEIDDEKLEAINSVAEAIVAIKSALGE